MKEAPRLGRGLASLFGDTAPGPNTNTTAGSTRIDELEPNPFQPRGAITDEDLVELTASIREQGLLQPILIRNHPERPGRYQIIAGERRWRAAKLAGLTSIPSFLRDLPDTAASAAALVENLQRQDLNPIEEAEGFRRLIDDFSLTQDELAKAIGKSRSHVANLLRLLQLPATVITHVRKGTLSAGHARAALACSDPADAAELMISRGLSVRQAEALATARTQEPPARTKLPTELEQGTANLRAVEQDLSEQLGLKVTISFNGQGGTISLRYTNLDQLDHVVERLGRQ
jgi:ParB family chromosome partitioning protein